MKKLYGALSILALFAASTAFTATKHVTSEAEYNRLANNGRPTVIEFSGNWCGVCNGVAKSYEELSAEPEFKDITFARVDIDELSDVSQKRGITGVPTFVFFQGGREKRCDVGVKNMGAFKENFRRCLRDAFMTPATTGVSDDTAEAFEDPEFVGTPEKVGAAGSIVQSIQDFFFRLLDFVQGFFNFAINGIKSLFGK